jgi:hypothetical protein
VRASGRAEPRPRSQTRQPPPGRRPASPLRLAPGGVGQVGTRRSSRSRRRQHQRKAIVCPLVGGAVHSRVWRHERSPVTAVQRPAQPDHAPSCSRIVLRRTTGDQGRPLPAQDGAEDSVEEQEPLGDAETQEQPIVETPWTALVLGHLAAPHGLRQAALEEEAVFPAARHLEAGMGTSTSFHSTSCRSRFHATGFLTRARFSRSPTSPGCRERKRSMARTISACPPPERRRAEAPRSRRMGWRAGSRV